MSIKSILSGYKTYLTGAGALIAVAVGYGDGSLTTPEAVAAAFAALQTIFLRAGIHLATDRIAAAVSEGVSLATAASTGLSKG